ncbi:hypothetical protein [Streptomyces sp. NPDC006285]|uniref:hypothetical protein n=1 Tax=Streptomyces sp. NPDC006285 TaxID=3364742 RepID=UPI00367A6CC0
MAEEQRGRAGGISGLLRLLREHGEAIAWDLPHYWPGRSLGELFTGEMSFYELGVFLRHLPWESATARAMRGSTPEDDYWTPDRQLAAAMVDAQRETTYVMVKLHGDPKRTRRIKPPEPIQRPGVIKRRNPTVIKFGGRHGSGAAELARVFGGRATNQ